MLFTLTRRTTVAPGEWVLVLGAGGGIGLAAVDVATALGARVIAAASTADKLAAGRGHGGRGHHRLRGGGPEGAGPGALRGRCRRGGRPGRRRGTPSRPCGPPVTSAGYCVIGFASGPIPSIPANQVLLNNRTVVGVDWGGWTFKDPLGNRALIDELHGHGRRRAPAPDGARHPSPRAEAAAVMTGLIDRTVAGKVVLTP